MYVEFRKTVTITLYVRQQKRHRYIEQTFGLCGSRRGGMIWENGIETCILSCKKWIASLGLIQDTGSLGLVHGDDPERCCGEGGGRGVHVWECKCILFNGWGIFHCVYVPQLSYPFICWWTSRLLACPGYYKQCCDEQVHVSLSFLVFLVYMLSSGQWHPTPVLWPGKSHGWRSLVGYSP